MRMRKRKREEREKAAEIRSSELSEIERITADVRTKDE